MNTYATLAARWAEHISPEDHAALGRLAARADARKIYAQGDGSDLELSASGFVQISRVFGNEPVALFGQDTPALAYSRLTITKAVRTEDGFAPGEVVFEARLSDRALTVLIMDSNKGRTNATLTGEYAGGLTLPAYTGPESKPSDVAFEESRQKGQQATLDALAELESVLASGATAKLRKEAQAGIQSLMQKVADNAGAAFYLDRRIDSLAKRRVELVSEAAYAALHADKLMAAFAQPRLEAPARPPFDPVAERARNPVFNACLDPMEPEERAAMLRVLHLEADAIAQMGGIREKFSFGDRPNWPSGQGLSGFSEAAKTRTESLNYVARLTMHKDHELDPRCFSAGIVWTQGWPGFLHSSLPSSSGNYATLHIESAWMETNYGDAEIRSTYTPVFEIMFAPDDLMMALRGHPTGAMTPVTFRRLAGQDIPSQRRERQSHIAKAGARATARINAAPETQAVRLAAAALHAHLEAGGTSKAAKAESDRLMEALRTAVLAHGGVVNREGFEAGAVDVAQSMRDMVRADLDDIRAVLPPAALQMLLPK